MWTRSLGTLVLLLFLPGAFPADTGQSLRDRYGPPISENFLVRPGVIATTTHGASGHVCEIVISPQRLWNSTLASTRITEIIDELVPPSERGKYEIGTFLDAVCFPTMDCGGSAQTWEKVNIVYNGSTGNEHYIRIRWRRGECDVQPNKQAPAHSPPAQGQFSKNRLVGTLAKHSL
jgi:hypothetical protein